MGRHHDGSLKLFRFVCVGALFVGLWSPRVAHGLTIQFNYIDSPTGTFASRGWMNSQSLFQQNIRAAGELWASAFDSPATLVVRVDTTSYAARAGGGFSFGRFLHTTAEGKQVWETGPLTRILTGDNPGENFFGYDIVLGFDASFVENFYWFDPTPQSRSAPVPSNKGDFLSVVLHEMGHGLGMAGNRDFATGNLLNNVISQFDELTYYGGNGAPFNNHGVPNPFYFSGPLASAEYGSDVPLTHKPAGHPNYGQNFYHFSACAAGAPDGLEGTLMNGCVLPNGARLAISPLETAVLGDLGYPLREFLPGNYNDDGTVDAADFTVWRDNLGSNTSLPNDSTPGSVTQQDYDIWVANFGSSLGSSSSLAAIPEPGCFRILAACSVVAGRTRRNYRPHSRQDAIQVQTLLCQ